jgi:hypothetical protein
MDFLKALFDNGAIDWNTFVQGVTNNGYKLADLSKGEYVAKSKYDDELRDRDTRITNLNDQLSARDTDLAGLKQQLEAAGTDSTKLSELTGKLTTLQADYDNAKTNYEQQLAAARYEFAVKEFANAQKFTSGAAKRDFVRSMIEEGLKVKDDKIIGADDYLAQYKTDNADSFVVEDPKPTEPKPQFSNPTAPKPEPEKNPFDGHFNFTGVRPFSNKE